MITSIIFVQYSRDCSIGITVNKALALNCKKKFFIIENRTECSYKKSTIASLNFELLKLLLKSVGLLCIGPVIANGISFSFRIDLSVSLIEGEKYLSKIKWISDAVVLHIFFDMYSAIFPKA